MSRRRAFLPCAFLALSTVLLASDGETPADPAGTSAKEDAVERGVPALFSWGDVDGDGRLELAAVSGDGTLQLLADAGDGRFEDVTERVGLAEVENAALALWVDYDGDGRLDLFVGAREGASRLFHNEGGIFIDMSAGSGLASEGAVQSAQWFDHDGDGRLDLFVVTAEKNELFRGLEGGFFELAELPLAGMVPGLGGVSVAPDEVNPDQPRTGSGPARSGGNDGTHVGGPIGGRVSIDGVNASGGHATLGPSPSVGSVTPLTAGCLMSLRDQANPSGPCIQASTTPTLGRLYPITSNLFVAIGGNVGINTTSPAARLHVAGTARITDTLTLNPGVDQALDVSTGSIYKGGALFIHTKGGTANTALGREALASVTTGFGNTAAGSRALYSNTTGVYNTASGERALFSNTTGHHNTASGFAALFSNTTGIRNTASGYRALLNNTTGYGNTASGGLALSSNTTGFRNTASGYRALYSNTTGVRNTALGYRSGYSLTTGSDNIAIGNIGVAGEGATIRIGTAGAHNRAFIAGIRGVTTGVANAIPVLVDSAGQLGTVSSSRRFKKDILDMGDLTERLLELRPVVFRYKLEQKLPNGGEVPLEYGLIAEEVAEVFPDLVVYDEEGQPFTVKYHLLSSMLLNELKELDERFEAQSERLRGLEGRLAAIETRTSPATEPAALPTGSR